MHPELFGIFGMTGGLELLVLLVVMLILFGHRLPSVMRSLGQGITEFKKGIRDDQVTPDKSITHEPEER